MSYDISATDISKALGVSRSTIHWRLCEYGISVSSAWTDLRDEEVDAIIGRILASFPNAGYRCVHFQLRSQNIKVPKLRTMESTQRLDRIGVTSRWLSLTPRKKYSVCGPLALWRIDGNHKLIR